MSITTNDKDRTPGSGAASYGSGSSGSGSSGSTAKASDKPASSRKSAEDQKSEDNAKAYEKERREAAVDPELVPGAEAAVYKRRTTDDPPVALTSGDPTAGMNKGRDYKGEDADDEENGEPPVDVAPPTPPPPPAGYYDPAHPSRPQQMKTPIPSTLPMNYPQASGQLAQAGHRRARLLRRPDPFAEGRRRRQVTLFLQQTMMGSALAGGPFLFAIFDNL